MTELAGKRALVTGAARGIGAAIVLELADKGADVVLTYERSAERASEIVRQVEAKGRRAFAIQADSADADAVKNAVDAAAARLGGLDILVNNAGVAFGGPLAEMPLEQIDKIIAVNIRGVVLASRAAIPHLADHGRIISIGSCVAEHVGFPGATVYSMSKSALLSFTGGLARELGPRNITVNVVHPGPTDTDMNPADSPAADMMRARTALGRYGDVEDVAAAVAFLASPAARHITGTGLTVDGGVNA
jgi:NAD(P)-dependent dehydrogenase (short-subunit alcohol dehydrogenase family)